MINLLNLKCKTSLQCVALVSTFLLLSRSITATIADDLSPREKSKAEIAKLLCGDDGALAWCAGMKGSECQKRLKAPIDKCSEEAIKPGVLEADKSFMRCFWREFTKEHGRNFRYTEECVPPGKGDSDVMPMPPELQERTRLLNPPQ